MVLVQLEVEMPMPRITVVTGLNGFLGHPLADSRTRIVELEMVGRDS
jgi:hypothetical protein